MNEKEIERLADKYLYIESEDVCYGGYIAGIYELSHAIVEQLKKGVVWEGKRPAYRGRNGIISVGLVPIEMGQHPDIAPSELLQVTVKKVDKG